jgi:hypothetical protein
MTRADRAHGMPCSVMQQLRLHGSVMQDVLQSCHIMADRSGGYHSCRYLTPVSSLCYDQYKCSTASWGALFQRRCIMLAGLPVCCVITDRSLQNALGHDTHACTAQPPAPRKLVVQQ